MEDNPSSGEASTPLGSSPQPTPAAPSAPLLFAPSDEGEPAPAPPPRNSRDVPTQPLLERFRAVVETVRQKSPRHATSLSHGRILAIRPGELRVGYSKEAEFHRTIVSGGSGRAVLEQALHQHFGRPTQLALETVTGEARASVSLAEQQTSERNARVKSTDDAVRSHPAVMATLRMLGGELEHVRMLEAEPERSRSAAGEEDESSPEG